MSKSTKWHLVPKLQTSKRTNTLSSGKYTNTQSDSNGRCFVNLNESDEEVEMDMAPSPSPQRLPSRNNKGIPPSRISNENRASLFVSRSRTLSVCSLHLNSKMLSFKSEEQSQLQLVEREEIDVDEDLFEAIDKLTSHGINAGDVKKLQDAGIYTCNGLMMHTKKVILTYVIWIIIDYLVTFREILHYITELDWYKGLSEANVDKICEAAEKIVNFGYITGSDALLRRKAVVRVTTGSQALDELLGGGIETLQITEAFGEFRSGKTQLAHTLCVTTQLPTSMKGGNGKVAYIDTEGTFRPDRIVPIAERFGMDAGAVLDNILYARAYTYEHQYNLLLGLAAKMSEEPFRLLIIDSVIALFRVDFTGRGELAERQVSYDF
ncbi:hypothetical protein R6Q59_023428 [Mikania micrantha]